jgi:hypothetical protein
MRSTKRLISSVLLSVVMLLVSAQPSNAWDSEEYTNDYGDKTFILTTYFITGGKIIPSTRPNIAHKQLALGCVGGELTIAFFDFNSRGLPLMMGSPTWMKYKLDGKESPKPLAVNTNRGPEAVAVTNSLDLAKKLKSAKTHSVSFSTGSRSYLATFDVRGVAGYSSKFVKAGCKF